MEPTKAQKNSVQINSLKNVREDLNTLIVKLSETQNSQKSNRMVELLREVDHIAIDRMCELGLTLKLEEER